MKLLQGLGISPGIANGPIYFYKQETLAVEHFNCRDSEQEIARLQKALEAAIAEMETLTEQAAVSLNAQEAEIFVAQTMILQDPDLLDLVYETIRSERVNAEYAWKCGCDHYAGLLAALADEYLAARAADVQDIARRVQRILSGRDYTSAELVSPAIILADDLTPSDTVLLDKKFVLGFCTAQGGATSHVAILSRAMGIPAVVGDKEWLDLLPTVERVILDGGSGDVWLDPDESVISASQQLAQEQNRAYQIALDSAKSPAISLDGCQYEIVANIGSPEDAKIALEYGAEGVGLFRTEFLFLDREIEPSEAEQIENYRAVLQSFGNSPVVVRTFDIGGDKPASYLDMPIELNPFLGVRGARLAFARPALFQTQLRALLRAGVNANLKIMVPMISSLSEVNQIRFHLEQVRSQLLVENIPFSQKVEIGIMVEVPSAALMADILAPEVDFFSIGTNDLTQYTLAADRTNVGVAELSDAFHPAVLRLIEQVVRAAHMHNRWVGLCGELAGDPMAAPLLMGLDIDELSMNPRAIPLVKQAIRNYSVADAKSLTQQALGLSGPVEVRNLLKMN